MRVPFYRSLDRSVDIFGLKGLWIIVFLAMVGLSVIVGIFFGVAAGTGSSVAVIIVLSGFSFMFCMTMQGRLPGRRLKRYASSSRCDRLVRRRETLSRILLEDAAYAEKRDSETKSREAIDSFFEN